MQKIMAPLRLNDKGSEVANLQDALRFLVDKGKVVISTDQDKRAPEAMTNERNEQVFRDQDTHQLVRLFQEQYQIPVTGEVDAPTAERLNALLTELGAFEAGEVWIVQGVVKESRKPKARVTVEVEDRDLRKATVAW